MTNPHDSVLFRFDYVGKSGQREGGEIKGKDGHLLFRRDDVVYHVLGGINPEIDYDSERGPNFKIVDGVGHGFVYFRKGTRDTVSLKQLVRKEEIRNGDHLLVELIRRADQTQYAEGVYLLSFKVENLVRVNLESVLNNIAVSAPN